MKILLMHNFHRKGSASGDDQVYKNEAAMLIEHGQEVILYSVNNDAFDACGIWGKIRYAAGMLWSRKNYKAIEELIRREKPDVVHVHTFFPLLSPSVLYAAKRNHVKVAATLHDTRFVCPCATSLRNGKLCNKCTDGQYFRMVKYRCFKGSALQSLYVAFVFTYHRIMKSFYRQIDRYICLNDSQIELLCKAGFDRKKIVKKYNFVADAGMPAEQGSDAKLPERFAVFYGRIGEEKGIRDLMKIIEKTPEIPFVIMGNGPLEEELKCWAAGRKNVRYLGYTPHEKCLSVVKKAAFVVFPSIWYEGCSMVEIEAESLGKPIIAADLGFSKEAVTDGYNGLKVKAGDTDGFAEAVRSMWNDEISLRKMGKNARSEYEQKYTSKKNYVQLISIYEDLENRT